MRKLNTILSVLLLVIFLLHGIMGSFMLLGIGSNAGNDMLSAGAFQRADTGIESRPMTSPPMKLAHTILTFSSPMSRVRVTCPAAARMAQPENAFTGTLLMLPKPMAAIDAKIQSCRTGNIALLNLLGVVNYKRR